MNRRPHRPLVCIDIAVPRDVTGIPNVHCYDIDYLKIQFDGAISECEQEVPRVEAIIAEEVAAYEQWLRGQEVAPTITGLRAKADAIRRAEVDKALRRLPHLNESERRQIEALTESLVNKLLHDPALRLKAEAQNGRAAEYTTAIRHLFALGN